MKINGKYKSKVHGKKIWQVFAHGFDDAHLWMSAVPNSYAESVGKKFDGAQTEGRVCELTPNPNGLRAYEDFLDYDEENMSAYVRVRFRNAPAFLPFVENRLFIQIEDKDAATVNYRFECKLKPLGLLFYPLTRLAMGFFSSQIIEELVYYSEHGRPHPRKLKKNHAPKTQQEAQQKVSGQAA